MQCKPQRLALQSHPCERDDPSDLRSERPFSDMTPARTDHPGRRWLSSFACPEVAYQGRRAEVSAGCDSSHRIEKFTRAAAAPKARNGQNPTKTASPSPRGSHAHAPLHLAQQARRCRTSQEPASEKEAPHSTRDRIRTCDLRFRKPALYPTELRGPRRPSIPRPSPLCTQSVTQAHGKA